jgi:sterol desaturase/sphingolipid hydroxylase (fatty acid hydroxylase superfamily)
LWIIFHFTIVFIAGTPPNWFSFFFTTVGVHSMHYSVGFKEPRSNFVNIVILWDRIFGTYLAGEVAPENLGRSEQVRLSVEAPLFDYPDEEDENDLTLEFT